MFVGEAPGANEILKGLPFVGQAGDLMDHVLAKLGIKREDIYITNCFKCRPENNELPGIKQTREWFASCQPYLEQEIRDVKPKVILLFGNIPLQLIAGKREITKHEGMEVGKYRGIRLFASFHPAYVLRSPSREVRLAQAIARAAKAAGMKINPQGWKAGMYDYEVRS